MPTEFIGIPVFEWPIDWTSPGNGSWSFDPKQLQIGYGPEILEIDQSHVIRGWELSLTLRDTDVAAVDTFFDSIKGRATQFWMPGPMAQFTISAGLSQSSFKVLEQGDETGWQIQPGLYLWFTKFGETSQIGQVNAVTEIAGGLELIITPEPLGTAVDETWQVQPLYLVRLADEVEAVELIGERAARRNIKVIELPHDYDRLEPGFPLTSAPVEPIFLYKFTAALPDGDVVWRFTSHADDKTCDSQTWIGSVGIDHGAIKRSAKLGGAVTINGNYDAIEPLRLMLPRRLPCPLTLEILETDSSLGTPTSLVIGEMQSPQLEGIRITAQCVEFAGIMDEAIPRFMIQRQCPYVVYDTNTCRADQASNELAVTATSLTGRVLTITGASLTGLAVDYLAQGWIEFGSGLARRVAFITASTAAVTVSGAVTVTVTLAGRAAPDMELPQAATAVPGCVGTRAMCEDRHDNLDNYGGSAPPYDNLTLNAISVPLSGGGKK